MRGPTKSFNSGMESGRARWPPPSRRAIMRLVALNPRGKDIMQNIQNPASAEELIQVVKQLSLPELEQLVDRVIAIRAERRAPHLTGDESELLARINQGLPAEDRARLRELITRRDAETITSAERQELIGMTDRLENLHAERSEEHTSELQSRFDLVCRLLL